MPGLNRLYEVCAKVAQILEVQFTFSPDPGSYEDCQMFNLRFVNPRIAGEVARVFTVTVFLRNGDFSTMTDGNPIMGADEVDQLCPWKLAVLQEVLAVYVHRRSTDAVSAALGLEVEPPPSEMIETTAHWLGVSA